MSIIPPSPRRAVASPALVCFSHLRWDSVFQRPQQLMSRFALEREVIFFEEPEPAIGAALRLRVCPRSGVRVATPLLAPGQGEAALRRLVDGLLAEIGPASA